MERTPREGEKVPIPQGQGFPGNMETPRTMHLNYGEL